MKENQAEKAYRKRRREHWNRVAQKMDHWRGWGGYYHRRIVNIFQLLVPSGQRVLELGCGQGDLLNALRPATGVGIDFSEEMIRRARVRHPHLEFIEADVHRLTLSAPFDFIIISDLVNDLWDVQQVFQELQKVVSPQTRILINTYSRLWELPLWGEKNRVGQTCSLSELAYRRGHRRNALPERI